MKYRLILLFAISTTVAWAQSDTGSGVLALSARKYQWLIHKQADSLDRVLDEKIQYIHSNGWVQNKREILDDMRTGKLVYQRVTIKEASVRVYGKAAVVIGTGTFEGINSGTTFNLDLRYTEVYVLSDTGWKLVSRHSNRMP